MLSVKSYIQHFGIFPKKIIIPYTTAQIETLCALMDDWAMLRCSFDGEFDELFLCQLIFLSIYNRANKSWITWRETGPWKQSNSQDTDADCCPQQHEVGSHHSWRFDLMDHEYFLPFSRSGQACLPGKLLCSSCGVGLWLIGHLKKRTCQTQSGCLPGYLCEFS